MFRMSSDFLSSPATRRSSKFAVGSFAPKRKITAIALRHALEISDLRVEFKIPITYLEKLKEGGFYECKSVYLTNRSHRAVKWCIDMRKSNKILEEGLSFKICNGSMAPFVSNGQANYGPEGEISPDETYELKVLFCPSKPGVYTCTLPIVVNNNFDRPYYYIDIHGELLIPEIFFEPECLILKALPLGMEASDQVCIIT